jgi:S1-C subfamily serine protease
VQDIIVEVNDKKINNARELSNAIGLMSAGDRVSIEYIRNGKSMATRAELGQRVATVTSGADIHEGLAGAEFGANTVTASRGGVEVTAIEPNSPAAQRGLREGDVIIAVNRAAVRGIADLIDMASQSEILFLLVQRGERQLMLQIR